MAEHGAERALTFSKLPTFDIAVGHICKGS